MKNSLPTGTVTLLFTDVEGSTKLLHELGPSGYSAALAEHRRILREAFARHEGFEVDTQGDAFFYAFPDARGAVRAAGEGRDELAGGPIQVRIGIHTGTPHLTDEGYIGPDVHKGARIGAAGHGGQVLLSKETRELCDTDVLDLGEHRLKDFEQPVWIYQLGDEAFPPLKTISNTNLPRPASSFVGRAREVEEIVSHLQDGVRLLTLTGPGGTGKTRLSLEAASGLVPTQRNGVFWVPLAALRDPMLVGSTIAAAVGAQDDLATHISDREMLLVLDNFEQVIDAAADVSSLLTACPNLRVLVTSRERLRVAGEVEYAVPTLARAEAMQLFSDRSGVAPDETIAEICARLDDLPLAVELAAARANLLAPQKILERLSGRLDILKGGRDADPRQATLRATIEWSYDLLDDAEKSSLARLAIFAGGCTLEAAEEVTGADIEMLQSLVDKSLVRHRDGRYLMLETIRDFALERLREQGPTQMTAARHLDHFVALTEKAYAARITAEEQWVPIVDQERDNIRAALEWASQQRSQEEAQLIGAASRYFETLGYGPETEGRLTDALSRYGARDAIRARALSHLGELVEPEQALPLLEEALEIWRELEDDLGEALALEIIGYAYVSLADHEAATASFEKSLSLRRADGSPELEQAEALLGLCRVFASSHDVQPLEPLARTLLELGRRHDDRWTVTMALHYLADCPLICGDYAESERRYLQALGHAHRSGLKTQCVPELLGVGMSLAGQGRHAQALRLAAAAYARRESFGYFGPSPIKWWREMQERHLGGAREKLSPAEVEEAEQAGRSIAFDVLMDEILGTADHKS